MVYIHQRVHERHPELSDVDVISAWNNQYRSTMRETDRGIRFVAVGFDPNSRHVEMVAVELEGGHWLIYHAMTPPSSKTLDELGIERRRR